VTVTAANARGIRITRIKYVSTQVPTRKRLRLIVTVRDIYGRLIRDAIVTIRPLPNATQTITTTAAGFTNAVGQAAMTVPVTTQVPGKRLQVLVSARTPKAHALEIGCLLVSARTEIRGSGFPFAQDP
jgi:hypothetical protein